MRHYPKEFLELLASITEKRPRTVIDHILAHGFVTTEELKAKYGYDHPPRAARDVMERGVALETFRVPGPDGRKKIAAYRFADPSGIKVRRFDGRTSLSGKIKDALIKKHGCRCFVYLEKMSAADLQLDPRVPYEIAGDSPQSNPADFMLLCGSANRAKSWSCEHCGNWNGKKDKRICLTCYWAFPEKYNHVAMRKIRRLDLIWEGGEIEKYEAIKTQAERGKTSLPAFVKRILSETLNKPSVP
jgi:hypothetical protein